MSRRSRHPDSDRRRRIVQATVDVAATVGFSKMTVADIASTARVGRRTFSWYFEDKHAAFELGYREITQELRLAVQDAADRASSPFERIHDCLMAVANFLAEDPTRATVLLVESHAAGIEFVEIRGETMRRLIQLLMDATADLPDPGGDRQVIAQRIAGGLHEVGYSRTLRGEAHLLPALIPELVETVLTPYLGVEGARQAIEDGAAPSVSGDPGTALPTSGLS